MRPDALAAIVGMALVTYASRAGGVWLMSRVMPSPRVDAWLRQIPGAILVSLVVPAALASGPAGALALVAAVAVARRGGNVLLAMLAGVGVVWLLRHVH